MRYTAIKVQKKSEDWKIADVQGIDGVVLSGASINRTNKKGEVFPNFDAIVEGYAFEANPWTNDAGKHYLFPPKAPTGGGRKGLDMGAAVAMKQQGIEKSQDRKDESIKTSSTARDATLILTALGIDKLEDSEWQPRWLDIRNWLVENYDLPDNQIPF